MPWLVKDRWEDDPSENIFFIHIPRCGGTSLIQKFGIPQKVMRGRSCWGQFGMRWLFRRYELYEKVNFPIYYKDNYICLTLLLGSIMVQLFAPGPKHTTAWSVLARILAFGSLSYMVIFSFLLTAPTVARVAAVRRPLLWLTHYCFCRLSESIVWCTGLNIHGYMMHFTAQKILDYGYVTADELRECSTLAIVRNPYSRMVSIYLYNRFGAGESFGHFVKCWSRVLRPYRERREMEEWYMTCHAIPQFEFTHQFDDEGKLQRQLIRSIVKQEELKYLKSSSLSSSSPPAATSTSSSSSSEAGGGTPSESASCTESEAAQEQPSSPSQQQQCYQQGGDGRKDVCSQADTATTAAAAMSLTDLPDPIRRALLDMPHKNSRSQKSKGGKKFHWYDYYTQETLDAVYRLYEKDFDVFGYDPVLEQRPDLLSPLRMTTTSNPIGPDDANATHPNNDGGGGGGGGAGEKGLLPMKRGGASSTYGKIPTRSSGVTQSSSTVSTMLTVKDVDYQTHDDDDDEDDDDDDTPVAGASDDEGDYLMMPSSHGDGDGDGDGGGSSTLNEKQC